VAWGIKRKEKPGRWKGTPGRERRRVTHFNTREKSRVTENSKRGADTKGVEREGVKGEESGAQEAWRNHSKRDQKNYMIG